MMVLFKNVPLYLLSILSNNYNVMLSVQHHLSDRISSHCYIFILDGGQLYGALCTNIQYILVSALLCVLCCVLCVYSGYWIYNGREPVV
jgi:hypothetical protein